MNKSSSFYSEAYYEKIRKRCKKKQVYRESHKQLYDQQHQLQIHQYYHNVTKKCEMLQYFKLLNESYLRMKSQLVKNNEHYTSCVQEFIEDIKKRMQYFHEQLMSEHYLKKQEYMALNLRSADQLHSFWLEQNQCKKTQLASTIQAKREESTRRLQTCNLCPIFIEQFQFNFQKALNLIIKNCEYWQQLNGHQKISKYRFHLQQNLNVLKLQLQAKCEYSENKNKNMKTRMPRPRRR